MEKWKKRAVNLISSIVFGGGEKNTVVPFYPQKIRINGEEDPELPRSIPEAHGISSRRIYNMLCELEGERRCNIHNLMILRDGVVISECSRPAYSVNSWHLSHSMTKSLIGMAVGLLYDDGLVTLDTRLVDIFPEIPYKDKRFPRITVEHLLTMTSGVPFGEAGSVTETEWSRAFFASAMSFAPGTEFYYNSMNSYMLAMVVTELSGRTVMDYVAERIFAPLGITNYFWEIGPENVEKGGWGIYLSAESWAKLGLMFMGGGVYQGKRILSEEWVRASGHAHAETSVLNVGFDYGYQMWVDEASGQLLFNGMLGQNVWMCPENNIMVVMQSGNNELLQDSPTLEIVRRHLGGEIEDPISFADADVLHKKEQNFFSARTFARPLEKHRGLFYFLGLKNKTPFDSRWEHMLHSYKFPENNSGILPLFVRAMQNNLDTSLDSLRFQREDDKLFMIVCERGHEHRLEVGLYEYKTTVLDFRGEKYLVSAMGEAERNPDDSLAFRVELVYPELPNTLMMRFLQHQPDRVDLQIREIPNSGVVHSIQNRLVNSHTTAEILMNMLDAKFGEEVIHEKIERTFAPSFVLANTGISGYEEIIAAEEERRRDDSNLVRTIKGFVEKFVRYEDEDDLVPFEAKIKNTLANFAQKIKSSFKPKK